MAPDDGAASCCGAPHGCVFAKALLAQSAHCAQAGRRAVAEQLIVECRAPQARARCAAFAARLRERARFALRLPGGGRPLTHLQALRLQCGGLAALRGLDGAAAGDVDTLLRHAQALPDGFDALPWPVLVASLAAWTPPRRRGGGGAGR